MITANRSSRTVQFRRGLKEGLLKDKSMHDLDPVARHRWVGRPVFNTERLALSIAGSTSLPLAQVWDDPHMGLWALTMEMVAA